MICMNSLRDMKLLMKDFITSIYIYIYKFLFHELLLRFIWITREIRHIVLNGIVKGHSYSLRGNP